MEFKIDTKPNYMHITPVGNRLDAKMAAILAEKCQELYEQGVSSYIIDMVNCLSIDNTAADPLLQLHEDCYVNQRSLVFTGLQEAVSETLKQLELQHSLNIAPTMIEAIDIINMEVLERDLFNEES